MWAMELDHLSYAAGPEGLAGTTTWLSELLGEKFHDGGIHHRIVHANGEVALSIAAGT